MKNKKENWSKEFDKKFTVKSGGKFFFDIEEKRTDDYIYTRKPTPKEIKDFIRQTREQARQEGIEEVVREVRKIVADYQIFKIEILGLEIKMCELIEKFELKKKEGIK